MFYKKRIQRLEDRIEQLELKIWHLENPPKFEIGEQALSRFHSKVIIIKSWIQKDYLYQESYTRLYKGLIGKQISTYREYELIKVDNLDD